jgi:hypothetical protein
VSSPFRGRKSCANGVRTIRYVWANLETDIINIGTSSLRDFDQVAPEIRRLGIERELSEEYFYYTEIQDLRLFVNVQEIHVVCADGLLAWLGALEEHYWPCGIENVYLIDPEDRSRIFKGPDGIDQIAELQDSETEE